MLMLKCKNCGEVFPGVYIPEDTKEGSKLKTNSISSMCVQEDIKTIT